MSEPKPQECECTQEQECKEIIVPVKMYKEKNLKEQTQTKSEQPKNIILFLQGGAGDILAQTPVIRYFRKKYPEDKIIVTSTYSQLLEHNTNIDELYPLNTPKDIYSKHIFQKDVRFYKKHFIYDHILDECAVGMNTLPEFACAAYNAEYDGGGPDYTITEEEHVIARTFLGQYRTFNKPIVLLHCTGSIPSDGKPQKVHSSKDLNIETISNVVKHFSENVIFIQIGIEGENVVPGVIDALGMPMLEAIALIAHTNSFIFIESLFAHAAAALSVPGVVVYHNTSPDFFTYPTYKQQCIRVHNSGGCPYWPCNRPLGALLDLMPGYLNPKTRERPLWQCETNLCRNITANEIIQALEHTLTEKRD